MRPKLFISLSLFLLLIAPYALAQEALFALPERSVIDELLGEDKSSSRAQTAKNYLTVFNFNCTTSPHPVIEEKFRADYCNCLTGEFLKNLETKDIFRLFSPENRSKRLWERYYQATYKNCLPDIVKKTSFELCRNNVAIRKYINKRYDVCTCAAQKLYNNSFLKRERLVEQFIQSREDYYDPAEWYLKSSLFELENEGYIKQCIRWHEYGWAVAE